MICFFLFKWDDALHRSTCRVLEAPVSMTLAPGRIEWSFRLSVAVWPLCPSVERRYVCDNTGLYRCGDGCLWSRSWQRRREIKKGRRQGWTTRWPLWITGKENIFYTGCSALWGPHPLSPEEHFIVFSKYSLKNVCIGYLQLFIAYQTVEMCFIRELVNLTHTASLCCAPAARQPGPFLPSFSLHIDESVISGGKLLCVWSVAAW